MQFPLNKMTLLIWCAAAASKSHITLTELPMFDWTHDELPQPTTDLATLKADIDEFGYCLVADAIAPEQLAVA